MENIGQDQTQHTTRNKIAIGIMILLAILFLLIVGLVGLLGFLIRGCVIWKCVPDRLFHVRDISLPDDFFPENALVSPISPPTDSHGGSIEGGSAAVYWENNTGVTYSIWRFGSMRNANEAYVANSEFLNIVPVDRENLFSSEDADAFNMGCYTNELWGYRCTSVGRYQEYVFRVNVRIDEKMAIADFNRLSEYIDSEIVAHLNLP